MTDFPNPSEREQIELLLKGIADEHCSNKLAGIALGVIVDAEEISATSGWADVESKRPVTTATVFELGSLTKLFTSLLLAVAVRKRELTLDDPVQPALGDDVTLPTDGRRQITYRSLANHRSSLPRLPDDLIANADMENPYARYSQEMLYACLSRMKSLKPIGSRSRYSNLGVGLLGHALGKIAGSNYHHALKERVLGPLEMKDTSSEWNPAHQAQIANAYTTKNQRTTHWDFTEVTAGAGSLRSNLSDMFKFLRANIDPQSSRLKDELLLMREPSSLPPYESTRLNDVMAWLIPFGFLCFLASSKFFTLGSRSLTQVGPGGLLNFLLVLVPTLAVACRWGRIPGAFVLAITTVMTGFFWRFSHDTVSMLVMGACSIFVFANWTKTWPKAVELLRGDGRLAWQSSKIGSHEMLWHNGMVGGSASFLGIVEPLGVGVVVLTNTAQSVDAIGIRILTELVKRKQKAPLKRAGGH